jgi:hypothetical protein
MDGPRLCNEYIKGLDTFIDFVKKDMKDNVRWNLCWHSKYCKFPTLLQLKQTRTRSGLLLRPHPTLWATADNGPLARVVFMVSSLAPEHVVKPSNFGFWSGYQPINTHWSDTSVGRLGWWCVLKILMSPEYACPLLHDHHISLYSVLRRWNNWLSI